MSRVSKRHGPNIWTCDRINNVRELCLDGYSDDCIAEALGPEFTPGSVYALRRRLRIVRGTRPMKLTRRLTLDELMKVKPNFLTPAEASVCHLIDLKRAGSSPTRTELQITDKGAPRHYAPEPCLMYRSPAAVLLEG